MDCKHLFRTALNERGPKDSFFNEIAPTPPAKPTDPNDPNKLKQPTPPPSGGTPPPPSTQPPVTNANKPPVQNAATAPTNQSNAAAQPAKAAQPGPATPAPAAAASQKAVSSMTISSKGDTDISNGITLPAGTQAVIAPGDLSGNVNVTFGGKTYSVPDANLKQLIKSGSLGVDQAESKANGFLTRIKASGL